MISVALIIFSGVQSLDVAGPMDVLAEANRFLLPESRYRVITISLDEPLVRCSNGLTLFADLVWGDVIQSFDLVLIAGGPDVHERPFAGNICEWIRRISETATRFGSVCSGAFILGRAGLLRDRTVTTHWNYADALASECDAKRVEADRIFVQDGRLYTSAGVTAGIDLTLHLLKEDHGSEVARNVAKRLVVVMQRAGGQSQFSPFLNTFANPVSPIADVQRYVISNLRETLSVAELAEIGRMSIRTFARTFTREVGSTPAEFVERARLDAARLMLESNQLPLKSVAFQCGFGTSGRMARVFIRKLGISPTMYRASFNACMIQ